MNARLFELLDNGATVLTASRRLAHSLRMDYSQTAQARGLVVWKTPSILPWSTFLLEACRQQRATQAHAPRILSELQAQSLWERIVGDSEAAAQLLNPAQAARNASRSWQRLHQYRLPLEKIAASLSEEARVFAGWAQAFLEITARNAWLDSARLGVYLLELGYVPDMSLRLCGFDRLTPDMERLLASWRDRGCDIECLSNEQPASRVQVVALKDSGQELETAARWARHQVESGRQRVAIVVADLNTRAAQARRVLTQIFAPDSQRAGSMQAVPAFTIAASAPLSGYAIVHHALLLLRLAQGRSDTLLVGQLLRSPFIIGYDDEFAARCNAELRAREAHRDYWDVRALERFAGANGCAVLSSALQQMAQSAYEKGKALPSEWTERFSTLLARAGWPNGRTLNSDELQTVIKFREVMADLSALDEVLGKIDFAGALNALRDGCNAARFAPESDEQAVTLIDADTVAGMHFDALWVTGLHASEWPPAPQPDPFLPFELQRQHGMPEASADLCLEKSRATLRRLVNSANEIVLSWPEHDGDAELQPSALLQPWPSVDVQALSLSPVRSLGQALFQQRPELERFNDERAPALAAGAVAGGTRSLELQSRCPFRAQAELRLHAAALPTVSPAIEATDRGKLVHKILAEFWQQLKSSEVLQTSTEAQRATLLQSIAERVAVRELPATTVHRRRLVELEIELAVQWIMALLRVEARRESFVVRRLEEREPFEFSGMHITIQLDRIDELADGSWLLIDYKTGGGNQAKDWLDINVPNRPRSPQLPLYALAHRERLAGITYAVLCPEESAFRGLARRAGLADGIEEYSARKPRQRVAQADSWDDLLLHWRSVLNSLAHAYLAGDAQVDPLKGECDYCHLAGLCRVNELLERIDEDDEEGGDD